jgi:hypothetical protein
MATQENKVAIRSKLYSHWKLVMEIMVAGVFVNVFLLSLPRVTSADVFSTNAVLSNDFVVTGSQITYTVNFDISFSSISEVDYFVTFGDDPLDPGECLEFTGDFPGGFGFCDVSTTLQTSRLLTIPCSVDPSVCIAFSDGISGGQITARTVSESGTASFRITSVTITIQGTPLGPPGVNVDIDINPGSDTNPINLRSHQKILVAILTTDTFDATTVDPTTVRFGRTGTEAAPVQSALEDVNGDGRLDMILRFNTQDTDFLCGDISATLTGQTFSGQAIEGFDSIMTVGCR